MKTTIQRFFYRNGQLREQVPLRNGRRHGLVRTWHKNGMLATDEHFHNGLLHGLSRQWDERGRLLGKYRVINGTGIQKEWHDNGQLKLEVSTVRGDFTGRNRIWLRDGLLVSERFYVKGRAVSAGDYRKAAERDKSLPRFRAVRRTTLRSAPVVARRVHDNFVNGLLEKQNRHELRAWLRKEAGKNRKV